MSDEIIVTPPAPIVVDVTPVVPSATSPDNIYINPAVGVPGPQGPTGPSGVLSVVSPITNTGSSTAAILGLDQTALSISGTQVTSTVASATNAQNLLGTILATQVVGTVAAATNAQNLLGSITAGQVTGTAAVLNAANTFTAAQTITPVSGTALTVNATSSAVGLQVKPNAADAIVVRNEADNGTVLRVSRLGGISVGDAIYSNASGSRAYLQPNGDTSGFLLGTNGAGNKGLVIKGATSQTANLIEWQNVNGTTLVNITASGDIETTGGMRFYTSTARTAYGTLLNTGGNLSYNYPFTLTSNLTLTPGTGIAAQINQASSAVGLNLKVNATTPGNAIQVRNSGDTANVFIVQSDGTVQSNNIVNVADTGAVITWNSGSLQIGQRNGSFPSLLVRGSGASGSYTQTVDLQRWNTYDGTNSTTVASVSSSGAFTISPSSGTALTVTGAASVATMKVQGVSGQNIQEWWATGAASATTRIDENGGLITTAGIVSSGNNTNSFGGAVLSNVILAVRPQSTNIGFVVRQNASGSTADMQQYRDSNNAVMGGRNALAQIYTGSTTPITNSGTGTSGLAITQTIATAGTSVQYFSSGTNYYGVGDLVTVSGLTTAQGGTTAAQVITSVTSTSFTTALGSGTTGTYTGLTATATVPVQASVTARSNGTIGLAVKGFSASQNASLQQWQDYFGSVLTQIDSSGSFITYRRALLTTGSATGVAVTRILGTTNQVSDLTQWQDVSSNIFSGVNAAGQIYAGSTSSNSVGSVGVALTSAAWVTNFFATITYGGTSVIQTGQTVTISGVSGGAYNGTFTVWSVTPTTFTVYSPSGVFTNNAGTGGTAKISSMAAFVATTSAVTPLIVKAIANQTANIQEWQDSNGNMKSAVLSNGDWFVGALYNNYMGAGTGYSDYQGGVTSLYIKPTASTRIGAVARGISSQTADLFQFQNSSGTVLGGRNALSQIYSGSTTPVVVATGGTIQSIATGANPLVTMQSNHGLGAGDLVTLAGTTGGTYDGTFLVSNPSGATFNITTALTTGQAAAGGTASVPAQASVTARSAGTVGLFVKAAATQVANVITAAASDNTTLFSVNSAGLLFAYSDVQSGVNNNVRIRQSWGGNGGVIQFRKGTASAVPNAADYLQLGVVGGTTAGTLKLVVRAGTNGAETTILDNIDQTVGTANSYYALLGSANTFTAANTFYPSTTAVSLTVRANGANMQEWKQSDSSLVSWMTNVGELRVRAFDTSGGTWSNVSLGVYSPAASVVPIVARGWNNAGTYGQTSDLQQWQSWDGTTASVLSKVTSTGVIMAGNGIVSGGINSGPGVATMFAGAAGNMPLVVRGAASQVADLFEIQNSSAIPFTQISNDGSLIIGEEATTNLVINPSFEVDTTNTGSSGQTSIARTTEAGAIAGSNSAKVVANGTAQFGLYPTASGGGRLAVSPSTVYSFSVYVKDGNAGTNFRAAIEWYTSGNVFISTTNGTATAVSTGYWTRVTITATAPSNAALATPTIYSTATPAANAYSYFDGLQFEQKPYPTSYVDGSVPGGSWSGTANASTSTRAAITRNAGGMGLSVGGTGYFLPQAAGVVGTIVRAASGQTANLSEWYTASGARGTYINSGGNIFTPYLFLDGFATSGLDNGGLLKINNSGTDDASVVIYPRGTAGATAIPLKIRGAATGGAYTQTQDLTRWQTTDGTTNTTVAAVSSSGALTLTPSTGVGLTVTPVSGQNSQVWKDSSGNSPTRMNEYAQFGIRSYGSVYNNASLSVNPGYDGGVGIGIRAFSATQSGDLQQWLTWDGTTATVRAAVSSSGAFTISPSSGTALTVTGPSGGSTTALLVKPGADSNYGLDIWRNSGASSTPLTRWMNETGATTLSYVGTGGNFNIQTYGGTYSGASLSIGTPTSSAIDVVIRSFQVSGVATQTGDLIQYQTGTTGNASMGGRNAVGQIYTGSTTPIYGSSASINQTIATASTSVQYFATATHNYGVGDLVIVSGLTTAQGGTTAAQVITSVTSTTFTTALGSGTTGTYTGLVATATVPAQTSITSRSAGTVGLVVKGTTGQTADLMQVLTRSGVKALTVSDSDTYGGVTANNATFYVGLQSFFYAAADYGAAVNIQTKSTTAAGVIVRGRASQSADMQQWQTSDGTNATTVAKVQNDGSFYTPAIVNSEGANVLRPETSRNISLVSSGAGSFGGGNRTVFIANVATAPTGVITGGGVIYVNSGALSYTGTSLPNGGASGTNVAIVNSDGTQGNLPLAINAQSTSYAPVLADAGKNIELNFTATGTATIPLNSSVAYPIGTQLTFIQTGTATVKVVGTAGVTVNHYSPTLGSTTAAATLKGQWAAATAVKRATDTWVLIGNLV